MNKIFIPLANPVSIKVKFIVNDTFQIYSSDTQNNISLKHTHTLILISCLKRDIPLIESLSILITNGSILFDTYESRLFRAPLLPLRNSTHHENKRIPIWLLNYV